MYKNGGVDEDREDVRTGEEVGGWGGGIATRAIREIRGTIPNDPRQKGEVIPHKGDYRDLTRHR